MGRPVYPKEVTQIPTLTPSMTSATELFESLSPDEIEKLEAQIRAKVSVEEIESIISPIKIGPCWKSDEGGSWLLPEKTLGWQIAGWCAEYLRAEAGGRWQFTLEQLRFILWWYAVDGAGRFVHRKGVLQRMKGWG
jgi:hypothetical protein